MKVLIKENKLFNPIYQYIDDTYDLSTIDYFHPTTWNDDEHDDKENPYIREYFYKDYIGDYDENGIAFIYIEKKYYNDSPSDSSWKSNAPTLIVGGHEYQLFSSMFGSYWKEPMIKWFEDKFGLPVKTITID